MEPSRDPPSFLAAPPAWAQVLDAASDLLALLDAQGRVLWANAAFLRATGLAARLAGGRDAAELISSGDGWHPIAHLLRAGRGFDTIELPWRHADGDTRAATVQARAVPPDPASAAHLLLSLHDITELQQLRAENQRQSELLDMTQEFGRLAVWERDIATGEGRWDPHMFRFFDVPPENGTPDMGTAADRLHPDDGVTEAYIASTRAAGIYEHRYRILRPDGSVRRVHSHWLVKNSPAGVPNRAIGLLVDDTETFQLADAFNKANALLKIAVDLGHIGIWRHDLTLNRLFYSDQSFKILGREPVPEGLPLDDVRAMIHPDDIPQVLASAQQALHTTEPVDMEARYRHADGHWIYILTRRVVHRDDDGNPIEFVGVGLDVSMQVEKLREASELAKRLEIAVNAAGVGIWSGAVTEERGTWNEQMFKIAGRPMSLGAPTHDEWAYQIIHPDDRAGALEARAAMMVDGHPAEHNARIVRPDGEVRWLVNRARHETRDGILMVFGVTIDVTERMRAEAALRASNERAALAARSVGMGTWEWDVITGEAVWDEAMFRLRGLAPRPQALNESERLAMTHPDDVKAVQRDLAEAATNQGPTAHEFRIVRPDGSVRWIASRSTPAPDERGELTRRIGINWDVTEARMAETSRREREMALRESQAKSEFLSRMSHELRTPLNAVLGFTRLLLIDSETMPSDQSGKLTHIQSAGEHLLALIDDALDLSSLESDLLKLDLQPVPLAEVLHEALPLVDALAHSQGVTIAAGELPGVLLGDRTRLRQMMINLLSNAIKYNRAGGRVTISGEEDASHVTFHVQDTGRGMTNDQLAHLFEPFNRLGAEREGIEGTGIGLSVVRTLAHRMHGEVAVSSRPGVGSTFAVRLPRASAPPPDGAPAVTANMQSLPVQRGRLLYIEDNPVNVLLVEELIRMRPGLSLESTINGLDGVACATATRPDLILIDIQLPDIDGFEVLRRLRAHPETSGIDCIALSANAMPTDISRARVAGFSDYWTKPIDFGPFLAALDERFPPA